MLVHYNIFGSVGYIAHHLAGIYLAAYCGKVNDLHMDTVVSPNLAIRFSMIKYRTPVYIPYNKRLTDTSERQGNENSMKIKKIIL